MSSTHSPITVLGSLVVSVCCVLLVPLDALRSVNVEAQTAEKEPYRNTGSEGAVSGKVSLEGEAPLRKRIDVSQDAKCAEIARNPRTEDVIVSGGRLANVFVYVKGSELERWSFETPQTWVVLDQRRCRFAPHVLGIQTMQPFTVLNSDPTTHNVHPAPRVNQEWNQSQGPNGGFIEKKFSRAETMIPVKCNQHPWMRAYIGVLAHSFFAVSASDGSFGIDGLPPGDYTVVAWHEVLGEQTEKITIGSGERKFIDFAFSAVPAARSSSLSLKMGSPIVVQ